jgi:hypothetical protein
MSSRKNVDVAELGTVKPATKRAAQRHVAATCDCGGGLWGHRFNQPHLA